MPIDVVNEEELAHVIEMLLKKYGPLMHIRKALGGENVHAEALIGIVRRAKTSENPSGVYYVYHDTMHGKDEMRDAREFRELLTHYKFQEVLAFWHYQSYENNTGVLRNKTMLYKCVDQSSISTVQKIAFISAGVVIGAGLFASLKSAKQTDPERSEDQAISNSAVY